MDHYLKETISEILETLEVPFSYNEKTEIFTLMIKNESSAYYVALWYREPINALNFSAPLSKGLSIQQLNDVSLDLLLENDHIAFGTIGVFHSSKNNKYTVVYNHTFTLERGSEVNITVTEVNEYISYMKYLFPQITEKLGESVGAQFSV